jgi:hypothetical protein
MTAIVKGTEYYPQQSNGQQNDQGTSRISAGTVSCTFSYTR